MTDPQKENATVGSIAARGVLYMLLLACVGLVPLLDVIVNPFGRDVLFTEFSFVQTAQSVSLVIGIAATGHLLIRGILPQLNLLFAALLTCALVRESDSFLDHLVNGLWQFAVALILAGTVFHLAGQRKTLNTQITWLTGHYSLGLMLSGFVIVTGFSRYFGQGALWRRVMGEDYNPTVKYFAEESIELLGYVILIIGVVEFSSAALRQFEHVSTSMNWRRFGRSAVERLPGKQTTR
ncbi:MAG: hypothetical protein ACR2Q3_04570 [Woeseiaceae bacterium]